MAEGSRLQLSATQAEQLRVLLDGAGVRTLDLDTARGAIRVTIASAEGAAEALAGSGEAAPVIVSATTVGEFLTIHPNRATAMARLGDAVTPGDLIGFIRIGTLLTPVAYDSPSGRSALLTEVLAEEGALVGWGSALFKAVER